MLMVCLFCRSRPRTPITILETCTRRHTYSQALLLTRPPRPLRQNQKLVLVLEACGSGGARYRQGVGARNTTTPRRRTVSRARRRRPPLCPRVHCRSATLRGRGRCSAPRAGRRPSRLAWRRGGPLFNRPGDNRCSEAVSRRWVRVGARGPCTHAGGGGPRVANPRCARARHKAFQAVSATRPRQLLLRSRDGRIAAHARSRKRASAS